MTNKFRVVLSAILCAAILFAAVSCGESKNDAGKTTEPATTAPVVTTEPPYEPENAAELWLKIDETMDGLDSFEINGTMEMTYYYMGAKFTATGTNYAVYLSDTAYSTLDTTLTCDEPAVNETIKSMEAYYDGKMYTSYSDSTIAQKLCSEMTFEEYEDAVESDIDDEVDLADCMKSDFEKTEDGWSLTFSGYTKKAIKQVMETFGATEDQLGADILDMEVKVTATEELMAKDISITFLFDEESDLSVTPVFSMVEEYSKYNEATFDASVLATEEYTQVDDVRILGDLAEAITEKQDEQAGSFVLELKTTTEIFGETEETVEKDTVTYGRKNGAYYYNIDVDVNGDLAKLQYQNGVYSVTLDGETESYSLSDSDAKMTIDSLIDTASYNAYAVTAVEKKDEGVYVLTVGNFDLAAYNQSYAGTGVELTEGSQQITVTMDGDELVKLESTVTAKGTYTYESQSFDMNVTFESVIAFAEMDDSTVDA
ncbi:MAG: hypothetical protein IJ386_08395 [Clostridia bacterium]|nr:hypothetical protein [Clostridia bacterium]